ncbi:hypothetical protein PBRA_002363 [Plasmodiophora brassicae]|nr:hypothetical protein PBRA_002363 [Plasmodiophora brassicae]
MSHDDVYVVNSTLAIGYQKGDIAGWAPWVDEHIRLGKRLLMMPGTVDDFAAKDANLPAGFDAFRLRDGCTRPRQRDLSVACDDVVSALGFGHLEERRAKKFRKSIELFVETSCLQRLADPGQISDDDVEARRVVIVSQNFSHLKALFGSPVKTRWVEHVLQSHGFDRLVTVRLVARQQTWWDFYTAR